MSDQPADDQQVQPAPDDAQGEDAPPEAASPRQAVPEAARGASQRVQRGVDSRIEGK